MTDLNFISLFCFQGARGFDGEPGPQGIPGAAVSSFSFTNKQITKDKQNNNKNQNSDFLKAVLLSPLLF